MNDYDAASRKWATQAPKSRFLGEITLSEPDTIRLMKALATKLQDEQSYQANAHSLAVLAVNCAYYAYDDKGFWIHFCQHLQLDSNLKTQGQLGRAIEGYLKSIDPSYRQRFGPFRFVGPILEQCGISHYYLGPYVNFVSHLKGWGRWNTVAKLEYDDYCSCIPEDLPKFLRAFLLDPGGWIFTTSVAAGLSQKERNLISCERLCSLPGYRPGFWRDFLKLYEGPAFSLPPLDQTLPQGILGTAPPSPPSLYWEFTPRLPAFVREDHVYMKPFPRVGVWNARALFSMDFLFAYDAGNGVTLIPPEFLEIEEGGRTYLNLDKLDLRTPCKLELWFEATGRHLNANGYGELNKWGVQLTDEITISCPEHLVAPEDSLPVTLQAPTNYTLYFPTCATKTDASGQNWAATCESALLNGFIIASPLRVSVEIPIHRDILRMDDGSKILLSTEVSSGAAVLAEGVPGSVLELYIQDKENRDKIVTGAQFGKEGKIKLNTRGLARSLTAWRGAWGLLSQGSGTYDGGLLYLNLPIFMEDITAIWKYPDAFFDALPKPSSTDFKLLANILVKQNGTTFDANSIFTFPKQLQAISWVLAACAKVFDSAPVINLNLQSPTPVPGETRRALSWFQKAQATRSNMDEDEIEALLSCLPEPKALYAPRWMERLEAERQRVERLNYLKTNFDDQLAEWIIEVKGPSRIRYAGTIAELHLGQRLTVAWRNFYHRSASLRTIFGEAADCSAETGAVGDLARLLQLAVLKESMRLDQMAEVDINNISEALRPDAKAMLSTEGSSTAKTILSTLTTTNSTKRWGVK